MCEDRPFKSTFLKDGTEEPPREIWDQLENEFVADYRKGRIIYSKDFYVALYKKIQEGMTYVQAFEALGFSTKVLGTDRANACGKRAVQMAKEGTLNTVDPSSYDGSVPMEKMGKMTPEEEMAYLKARNIYLETIFEIKKKTLSELLEKPVSSIKVKR
ncbi:MAG: hypothetical protein IKF00_03535 [Solobacterium sp.]|jgi:hypothetical protein|nr:hypothetical protein [Erysipelotrichaceae bacterium]MBR2844265.1 hypothetical protein [Solobacterium sp.]MBR3345097.1 hypothetical protein [Solobacterium sp.]MBR3462433.1 hypothetical protein [Clostridiales bacterium]MCR5448938.1 hypothetical protein [Solobacterium sp.]